MSDGQTLSRLSPGRRVLVIGALVALGAGIGFGARAVRSRSTPSSRVRTLAQPTGHIAIAGADPTGVIGVYTMRADGSAMIAVPGLPGYAYTVSWSPDGTKVAFDLGTGKGQGEIDLVLADGSGRRTLTDSGVPNAPAWSPDGSKIAFFRWVAKVGEAIAVMNVDGSRTRVITNPGPCTDLSPTWSPDGTEIAFWRDCQSTAGGPGIYVTKPDGTSQRRVLATLSQDYFDQGSSSTNAVGHINGLAWSPDGSQIAFGNVQPGDAPNSVEVMNADGSGIRILAAGSLPAWSPDGAFIAFACDHTLCEMRSSGQLIRQIKETAGFDLTSVSWGP